MDRRRSRGQSSPRLIALDLAGCCGVVHTDGYVDAWQLSLKSDAIKDQRLLRLYSRMMEVYREHPYEAIGAEHSAFGSPSGSVKAMHNEFLGVLKLVSLHLDLKHPVYLYYPTSIKKFATGNGKADKLEVIAACRSKLGIETDSSDIADAAWVLEMLKQEALTWKSS